MWRAETIVYLGQPFAPLGGGQIQSLATNPRTVGEIIRSESVLQDISKATGIPVSKLRSSISTRELVATGQIRGINPLIEIAVKGSGPVRVEQAADELAELVVERVSIYVTEKTALLKQQVAVSEGQLAAVESRIARAQEQQDQLLETSRSTRGTSAPEPEPERGHHDGRRAGHSLQDDLFEARQLLNLAESVESSRVVEPAAASKTTARSSGTSLLVGALISSWSARSRRSPPRRSPLAGAGRPRPSPDARGEAGRGRRTRVRRGTPPRGNDSRNPGDRRSHLRRRRRSRDRTTARAEAVGDPRVELIRHERNSGVGAAIATGTGGRSRRRSTSSA